MMRAIATRLRKLEDAITPPSRVVVVEGRSDAEHAAKIEALKASGAATSRDLFICIMRFFDPAPSEGDRP